jgi:hypothetical protein
MHFRTRSAEYADVIGFIFGLIEIFRRFIWNYFRLENEHLNNCGEFRAVRDISIAPISTVFDHTTLEDMMDKDNGIRNRRNATRRHLINDYVKMGKKTITNEASDNETVLINTPLPPMTNSNLITDELNTTLTMISSPINHDDSPDPVL